ncbi:MAG: beta-galactosidase [Chloroflexia bacterium]|nr:beta-galactosidase [Chloroflexia bacterium]
MKFRRWPSLGLALAILLPLLLSATTPVAAVPGTERSRYFPETGFTVNGYFLDYWENHGGLYIYGYPITEEFYDVSTNGQVYLTQYFERAIFEYHPENEGTPYVVLLRLLGNIVSEGRWFEPAPEPHYDSAGRLYFEHYGGHSLSGVFLYYWQNNGGLPVFGYPISEPFSEVSPTDGNTYLVQYFERNRFEYHPELAGTPYEVLLGLLGQEYKQRMEDGGGRPAPTPTPTPAPTPAPPPGSGLQYGFCVHLTNANMGGVYDLVQGAGFGWIRQQVRWADIEPAKGQYNWGFLDQIVNEANRRGVKVLFSVVASPGWAAGGGHGMPSNPNDLGDFFHALASRYKGRVGAYEVWNEENYAVENDGYVAGPDRYVELLKVSYTRIKQADPKAIVVLGALTPTGVYNSYIAIDDLSYLRQLLSYQGGVVRDYFDVLGAHVAGTNNSPDHRWPDNPGPDGWTDHTSHYFRQAEEIRAVMVDYGFADKQIWLTEFGWAATENVTSVAAPGYEYAYQNSEQEQAAYLVRAFEKGRSEYQPWMGAMFLWNLNFAVEFSATDEKAAFGVLRAGGIHRPAYDAVAAMPK